MAIAQVHQKRPLLSRKSTIALLALVVVVVIFFLLQPGGPMQIASNRTVKMNLNSSFNFELPDNSTPASIFLESSSNSTAVVYISTIPVLEKHLYVAQIGKGNYVNISVYGYSAADLQITMINGGTKNASISLAYIPRNLNIKPTPLALLNATSTATQPTSTQQSTLTTTIPSTTIAATTTIQPQVNSSTQAILYANASTAGILMINYGKLYSRASSQCTSSAYNSTYATKHGGLPSGQNTYNNATQASPISVFATAAMLSSTLYNVTYTAVIKNASIGNLKSLTIGINMTSKSPTGYQFGGIFEPGSSLTTVLQEYQALNASTNPCSPYVP